MSILPKKQAAAPPPAEGGARRQREAGPAAFASLLNVKPSYGKEEEEESVSESDSQADFDPEDEDFGGRHDGTRASARDGRSAKRGAPPLDMSNLDGSRAHYRGLVGASKAALSGRSAMKRAIDEDDFMGGKYAGVKQSRAGLGFKALQPSDEDAAGAGSEGGQASSGSEEDEEESDDDEEPAPKTQTIGERLKEFKDAQSDQIEIVTRKAVEDRARGEQVRGQLKEWQAALDLRIKMQPLVSAATRFPAPAHCAVLIEGSPAVREAFDAARETLQALCDDLVLLFEESSSPAAIEELPSGGDSGERLARLDAALSVSWKESLDRWHQKVSLLATLPGLRGKASAKRQMKVIDQSLWTQVQAAMRDRARLTERTRTLKSPMARPPIALQEGSEAHPAAQDGGAAVYADVFDDGDFFATLLRDYLDSGAATSSDAAAAAGLTVKSALATAGGASSMRGAAAAAHHHLSKGRRLNYDVHTKLVNYMVPIVEAAAWSEDKADAFIRAIFSPAT